MPKCLQLGGEGQQGLASASERTRRVRESPTHVHITRYGLAAEGDEAAIIIGGGMETGELP